MALENLRGFERLFNSGVLETDLVAKAIQLGWLKKSLNRNNSANRKAIYNKIINKHFSNRQKLEMLRAVENETNVERVKLALNSVDRNLLNRNEAYNNAYNRVLNKHGVNRVRTRRQQGGTCWFHAIINGLLMSPRPRRLLKRMTANVPSSAVNSNACPSRRTSREWFLRYIKHRLEGPGTVNSVFRNANVIRSAGLRGLGSPRSARYSLMSVANSLRGGNASGGSVGDMAWFYKKMFPGPMFAFQKFGGFGSHFGRSNPSVPHFITKNGLKYELTHALISFWVKPLSGHAITGYKTARGDFVAYDSGFDKKVPDYDWTKPARVAAPSIMWEKVGYKTGGTTVHAVYMLEAPSS
jgi:hypothetical protein